jgi:hypothetical protein
MKTYIRKSIKGYYIDFPDEIDAQYWAGKIGSTYEDFQEGKWILLSAEQIAFHAEHPNASIQHVITMTLPEPYVRTLEDAKREKLMEIDQYDRSSFVNSFDVMHDNEVVASSWLTPSERANYRSSIDAAELVGLTELSLYIGEMPVTLSVATAKLMLAQIQLYADQCFIVTKQHKTAVDVLDTIEAVDAYDVTTDYPQKLVFTI